MGKTKIDIEPPARWPLYSSVRRVPPAVHRLSPAVGTRALDALIATDPAWAADYIYPPSTIHMTVLFLTPYLGIGSRTDPDDERDKIAEAVEAARNVFEALGPMTVLARTERVSVDGLPPIAAEDRAMPYKDKLLSEEHTNRSRGSSFPRTSGSPPRSADRRTAALVNPVPPRPSAASQLPNRL